MNGFRKDAKGAGAKTEARTAELSDLAPFYYRAARARGEVSSIFRMICSIFRIVGSIFRIVCSILRIPSHYYIYIDFPSNFFGIPLVLPWDF